MARLISRSRTSWRIKDVCPGDAECRSGQKLRVILLLALLLLRDAKQVVGPTASSYLEAVRTNAPQNIQNSIAGWRE